MKLAPFGISRPCVRKGLCAVGSMALMMVMAAARGSEMDFSGRLSLSLRGIENDDGGSSLQRTLTGSLTGFGYLWRPWFARAGLQLDLSRVITEQDNVTGEQKKTDDLLTGGGTLNLFPLSRFPTNLFASVSDYRVETGNALLNTEDINVLTRESYGILQQYRPRVGTSHYALQYRHDKTTENDGDSQEGDEFQINGSHSVTNHSLRYKIRRSDKEISSQMEMREETLQSFYFRHNYVADSPLSIENTVDRSKDIDLVNGVLARQDQSSFSSFLTWRPSDSPLSLRGNVSVVRRDNLTQGAELESETAFASIGMVYQASDALNVSGDIGRSQSKDRDSRTDRHFENVSVSYSPETVNIDPWRYTWGVGFGIGNSGESGSEDIRSASGAFRHGLSRLITTDTNRSVSIGLNQSLVQNRDSLDSKTETLTHSGTVAAVSSNVDSTGRLQVTVSDSRSRGRNIDRDRNVDHLDEVVKTLSLTANFNRAINKYSRWSADANFGMTKINRIDLDEEFRYGAAAASYINNFWLQTPRLRLQSGLEYSVRESLKVEGEASDETRMVWDSRVDYTVGLLVLGGRFSVTSVDGRSTRSFLLSATRHF